MALHSLALVTVVVCLNGRSSYANASGGTYVAEFLYFWFGCTSLS